MVQYLRLAIGDEVLVVISVSLRNFQELPRVLALLDRVGSHKNQPVLRHGEETSRRTATYTVSQS